MVSAAEAEGGYQCKARVEVSGRQRLGAPRVCAFFSSGPRGFLCAGLGTGEAWRSSASEDALSSFCPESLRERGLPAARGGLGMDSLGEGALSAAVPGLPPCGDAEPEWRLEDLVSSPLAAVFLSCVALGELFAFSGSL